MSPFLLYIARASLYLALFYAFFLLVMRRTTLFRFNRITLLAGTLVCHVLPLLRLRTVIRPESVSIQVGELEMIGDPVGASVAPFPWIPVLYAAGVAAIVALSVISVARTRRIIRSGVTQTLDGCRLTLTEGNTPSFSWGRHIVMSRADYEQHPAILGHERAHIQAHHSLDILLMTAVAAIHWFNPLVWITRAELRLLHEYEADQQLLQQGIDATQYQLLLVRKAVGEQRFSLANGFNHAKLKQRITMMQHKPTSGWMRLAYAAVLPVLAGTMFLCNPVRAQVQNTTVPPYGIIVVDDLVAAPDSVGQSVPFSEVDQAPTFQGGNANEFGRWVAQHLTYPEAAKEAGIMGHVMLQFKICSDGEVREVEVLRSAGNDLLDDEAVRVLSASPKWEPGYVDGKPVNVTFQFPVVFQLRDRTQVRNDSTVRQVTSYPVGDGKGVVSAIRVAGPDGAEPLVILDGVKQAGGRKAMEKIDPSTIESIEILKDEASTAKYGPEAKYGVILITLKKNASQ